MPVYEVTGVSHSRDGSLTYRHKHTMLGVDANDAVNDLFRALPDMESASAVEITRPSILEIRVDHTPSDDDVTYTAGEPEFTLHDMTDGGFWGDDAPAFVAATFLTKQNIVQADDWYTEEYYINPYTGVMTETSYHLYNFSRGEIDNIARIYSEICAARGF